MELRKENFNLKLKLFYTNEKLRKAQPADHTMLGEFIELQVKMKELTAQSEHRRALIVQARDYIKQVEGELDALKRAHATCGSGDTRVREMEKQMLEHKQALADCDNALGALQVQLSATQHREKEAVDRALELEAELQKKGQELAALQSDAAAKSMQDTAALQEQIKTLQRQQTAAGNKQATELVHAHAAIEKLTIAKQQTDTKNKELAAAVTELQAMLTEHKARVMQLETEAEVTKQTGDAVADLQNQLGVVTQQKLQLEQDMFHQLNEAKNTAEQLKQQSTVQEDTIHALEDQLHQATGDYEAAKQQQIELESAMRGMSETVSSVQDKVKETEQEAQNLRETVSEHQQRLREAEQELAAERLLKKALETKLGECSQQAQKQSRQVAELEQRICAMKADLSETGEANQTHQQRIQDLSNQLDTLRGQNSAQEAKCSQLCEENLRLMKQLSDLHSELTEKQSRFDSSASQLKGKFDEQYTVVGMLRRQFDEASAQLQIANRKVDELQALNGTLTQQRQRDVERERDRERDRDSERDRERDRERGRTREIEQLEKDLAHEREALRGVESGDGGLPADQLRWFEAVVNALPQDGLSSRARDTLSQLTSALSASGRGVTLRRVCGLLADAVRQALRERPPPSDGAWDDDVDGDDDMDGEDDGESRQKQAPRVKRLRSEIASLRDEVRSRDLLLQRQEDSFKHFLSLRDDHPSAPFVDLVLSNVMLLQKRADNLYTQNQMLMMELQKKQSSTSAALSTAQQQTAALQRRTRHLRQRLDSSSSQWRRPLFTAPANSSGIGTAHTQTPGAT
eukprot:TRINITY_DN669_c0_g1_i3.p1 TRINITY_DN669_c0_g1~~TRINITY_DN669_c0_g1_i3.p1  ORF type:complete len:854 (+),score=271.13 TRINITY_DN669_c0_g1_i3:149-2563(+)